jgi:hypothetical protein
VQKRRYIKHQAHSLSSGERKRALARVTDIHPALPRYR